MTKSDLSNKRVLLLGAETELGAAISSALAKAGAGLAVVAAGTEPEAAFAVQRLARRLSAPERPVIAQAIDATNEMAVRVMVKQASRQIEGLDALVFAADLGGATEDAFFLTLRWAGAEMFRRSGGTAVWVDASLAPDESKTGGVILPSPALPASAKGGGNVTAHLLAAAARPFDQTAAEVLELIEREGTVATPTDSG